MLSKVKKNQNKKIRNYVPADNVKYNCKAYDKIHSFFGSILYIAMLW